jgi:SAM-dependent methyltransferase
MKILHDYGAELELLEEYIRKQAKPGKTLQVLEAGCGREWYFRMKGIDYELTGLDLDGAALQARQALKGDLKHCIVGDLRTVELEPERFDVIYNAFVLEHVEGAEKVLNNFARWLKPLGILILRVPDRDGVQGLVARMTPHWFHVLYHRWVWRLKDAGKPGFAPYPTIYDHVVSRPGLREFCSAHNLTVLEEIGVGSYRRGFGLISRITPTVARIISLLTLGKVHDRFVDFTLVAQKAGPSLPDNQ